MSFDSDVRWFANLAINGYSMAGMPRCSGTAGDLIAMLDFFLNTGGNLKTLSGLSRASTTATAAFSGSPGFVPDQVVQVAGANQSEWNDLYRIATVGASSVTFTVPNTHTASPTGTITMKAAPVGWTCANDGNNIYRAKSASQDMSGLTLYVDDSAARYARVRGWESWNNGVGSGPFPTDSQLSGGGYFTRSDAANTNDRNYIFIADRGLFYLFVESFPGSYSGQYTPFTFGDIISWLQADGFGCVIVPQSGIETNPGGSSGFWNLNNPSYKYLARDMTLNPNTACTFLLFGPAENGYYLGGAGYTYPNPLDGGDVIYDPIRVAQTSAIPRGVYPGLSVPLHAIPYLAGQVKANFATKPGKKLITLKSSIGCVLIDIMGPWR